MAPKTSGPGDEHNESFGSPQLQNSEVGFERGVREREAGDGNHRFRLSEEKDVPQAPLAERVRERKEQ